MLIAALTVLVGFIILIWSADLFVAGASSIAENLGMSPIVIGLTIVSLGTSAPEIIVSLSAALQGAGNIANAQPDDFRIRLALLVAGHPFGDVGKKIGRLKFQVIVIDANHGVPHMRSVKRVTG